MLEIVDLTVGRRTGPVLLGPVTLSGRPGEVVGLAGPSGCGKTLLLSCLSGQAPRRSGEVRWQGRTLSDRARQDARRVALLSDAMPLAAERLTVRRCLELAAGLLGLPRSRVAEVVMLLGLGAVLATPVAKLPSGLGELLRLALLELPAPPVVLLDHPLARLDGAGRHAVQSWLDQVRARQACALWAGPGAGLLERVADRVAVLERNAGVARIVVRGQDGGQAVEPLGELLRP